MSKRTTDILIIGGGVPGLALACLLGRLGLDVTVAEKYPAPPLNKTKPDTRTAALLLGSVDILKATGAWDLCKKHGETLQTLRIVDDDMQVDFAATEIDLDAFGTNMPNAPLRAALAETAKKIKTVTMVEAGLKSYEADEFSVTAAFDNGEQVTAALIVGADGRESPVRTFAGIETWQRDYGQQAITCVINHVKPHDNVSTEFHRPSGPFTLVPLPGKKSSVVWVDFNEPAEEFMAMDKTSFTRALQERSRDMLGKVTLAAGLQIFPLQALRAKRLTGPRMALVAEAAHVLHPIGAQGLNLSLRDVAALAETIADAARAGIDIGSTAVLQRYENRRRQDVMGRIIGTDGLNRIVSNNFGIARGLRRIGLKAIDSVSPLKEFSMRQGLSPKMKEDRLAAGLPL